MTNNHDADNMLKGIKQSHGNAVSDANASDINSLLGDRAQGKSVASPKDRLSHQSDASPKAGSGIKNDHALTADGQSNLAKATGDEVVLKEEWTHPDASPYPAAGGFDGATRDWNALSRRVWQISRAMALFLVFAILVGWPLGDFLAHRASFGSGSGWTLFSAYPPSIMLFAVIVPALVIFSGYVLSRAMTTTHAAEEIAAAARHYVSPDKAALQEVEVVGTVVREQMDVLNAGLETALMRLAGAEAMIRKHVDAIETAGVAIETQATGAVERVASERTRLIGLTEKLNTQADSFASAIAERTQANLEAMDKASTISDQVEARFDERLGGLEKAADTALGSFKNLLKALEGADGNVRETAQVLNDATQKTIEASQQSIEASEEAKRSTQKALSQSLIDESAMANIDTVKKAVEQSHEKASEEALRHAREEGSKIAKAMIEAASGDIEKVAKQASDQTSNKIEQTIARSEEATKAAKAKQEELVRVHEEIEKENERLEKLIAEQKSRAERLANGLALAIKAQTEKLAQIEKKMQAEIEEVSYPDGEDYRVVRHNHNKDDDSKIHYNLKDDTEVDQPSLDEMGPLRVRLSPLEQEAERNKQDRQNQQPEALKSGNKEPQKKFPQKLSSRDVSPPSPTPLQQSKKAQNANQNPSQHRVDVNAKNKDEQERLQKEKQILEKQLLADPVQTPREDLERLSELAQDLSERRQGGSHNGNDTQNKPLDLAQSSQKRINPSWKEILAAADNANPSNQSPDQEQDIINAQEAATAKNKNVDAGALPLEKKDRVMPPAQQFFQAQGNNERETSAIRVITRLQQFTMNLDERLYGDLPSALIERFHQHGDRNIFANRLLRLNETDVKKRIRMEGAKDIQFENDIRQFLKEFDGLLEDAAQSSAVDEELREYLSSPLGRIYLLIGEIVGYFA